MRFRKRTEISGNNIWGDHTANAKISQAAFRAKISIVAFITIVLYRVFLLIILYAVILNSTKNLKKKNGLTRYLAEVVCKHSTIKFGGEILQSFQKKLEIPL